ncbi:PEP-CTERM putative exosortase interaction domain-containing protein [Burkholderiales bacterium JOSHI_001]|nr:PEP-CTERM putative exosortase interaction domain-containing protein [Burkholderiales bacterium JOSHI_001]
MHDRAPSPPDSEAAPIARIRAWTAAAAVALLVGMPWCANAAEASLSFGSIVAPIPLLTDPVAIQDSRHVDNASATIDFQGSASLLDGTLRAKLEMTPHTVFLSGPAALVRAQLDDRLTVVGPGTGIVVLQLRMDVHALMTVDANMGPNTIDSLELSASMSIDNVLSSSMYILRRRITNDLSVITEDSMQCLGQPCNLNQPLTPAGIVDGQVIFDVQTRPGISLPFQAYLLVTTYGSPEVFGAVDASNTASISYALPAGYTLTSQSGLFLSAVPEPSTTMLAMFGGAVVWVGWRRRSFSDSRMRLARCDAIGPSRASA